MAPSGDSLRSQSPGFSENYRTTHVIANQRRNAGVAIRSQSLPLGEGGSRVSRKRETDEGKRLPLLTKRSCHGRLPQGHD